jgi:hypothetical protein
MSDTQHHIICDIIKDNKLFRFVSELEYSKSMKVVEKQRVKDLEEVIENVKNNKNYYDIQSEKEKEYFKILKDLQFKKKWQFLTDEQKDNRINEYLERKGIVSKKKIKDIKKSVSTDDIVYDNINGFIADIKNI